MQFVDAICVKVDAIWMKMKRCLSCIVVRMRLKIIAIDPGQTTGYVHLDGTWEGDVQGYIESSLVESRNLDAKGTIKEYEVAKFVMERLSSREVPVLIIEDFVLYGGTHSSDRSGLSPVRVTSALLTLLLDRDSILNRVAVSLQMASLGKDPINVRIVEEANLPIRLRRPHSRDALLHAVYWLRHNSAALDAARNRDRKSWK